MDESSSVESRGVEWSVELVEWWSGVCGAVESTDSNPPDAQVHGTRQLSARSRLPELFTFPNDPPEPPSIRVL